MQFYKKDNRCKYSPRVKLSFSFPQECQAKYTKFLNTFLPYTCEERYIDKG